MDRRLLVAATMVVLGLGVGLTIDRPYAAELGVFFVMGGFLWSTQLVQAWAYVGWSVACTACVLAIGAHAGLHWTDIGLGHTTWLTGILWSAGLIALVAAVVSVAGGWHRTRHVFADARITEAGGREIARRAFVEVPWGTVLVEEVAFRGVLLALLQIDWWALPAALVSSALFGLWHVLPALEMHESHASLPTGRRGARFLTVAGTVLFTGLAGFGFCLLRLFTGSLLPPAALHWAANSSGIVAGWWLATRGLLGAREAEAEA